MYTHTKRLFSIPSPQTELEHQGGKRHMSTIQPPSQVKTALELSLPLEQWEHLIQQTGNKAAAEATDRLGAGAAHLFCSQK